MDGLPAYRGQADTNTARRQCCGEFWDTVPDSIATTARRELAQVGISQAVWRVEGKAEKLSAEGEL